MTGIYFTKIWKFIHESKINIKQIKKENLLIIYDV